MLTGVGLGLGSESGLGLGSGLQQWPREAQHPLLVRVEGRSVMLEADSKGTYLPVRRPPVEPS